MSGAVEPAGLPPAGLPDLDSAWSRLVSWTDGQGKARTSHVLDAGPGSPAAQDQSPVGVVLCVHGNPTWSYLWRGVIAKALPGWRVVAIDHLDMGYSERTGTVRRLDRRIDDLDRLTAAMGIAVVGGPPVVTVAHDWGGPISLGWAMQHADQIAGIALFNTALNQPAGSPAPTVIRAAGSPALLRTVTVNTPTFVRATTALSRPGLSKAIRAAYAAPYATPARREAVGTFVADIPLDERHPSWGTLASVRAGIAVLQDKPAFLGWGPSDPVFADRYLRDVIERLPQAQVQRYEGASHLVTEDAAGAVNDLWAWIDSLGTDRARVLPLASADGDNDHADRRPLWQAIAERATDPASAVGVAVAEWHDGVVTTASWGELDRTIRYAAAGLRDYGVKSGDRVALLVPPGIDLTTVVYACWRIGAVVVIADAGLGPAGLGRALRGAWPDHVIGIERGLVAATVLRVSGQRIAVGQLSAAARTATGTSLSLAAVIARGSRLTAAASYVEPPVPQPDAEAAVVFTSGATGPAKGVVYRHRAIEAQRDALAAAYAIGTADSLVAGFAPFALYGPALGVASAVPDMDVTKPSTLTAGAVANAAALVNATLVFASPAALVSTIATAADLLPAQSVSLSKVRALISAGAPVPAETLQAAQAIFPAAQAHTPYGMTEALPITDVTLEQIEAAGAGNGVFVGHPLAGVDLAVVPLNNDGQSEGPLTREPGVVGEISVAAPWMRDRYDRLAAVTARAERDPGRHLTGDVGHFDADGGLWVEGRLVHVFVTAAGPVTPVGPERAIERAIPEVVLAALVGVGPSGTAVPVAIVTSNAPDGRSRRGGPRLDVADHALAQRVREAAASTPGWPNELAVAAVLTVDAMPVDIRHNSKIDRALLSTIANKLLAGRE